MSVKCIEEWKNDLYFLFGGIHSTTIEMSPEAPSKNWTERKKSMCEADFGGIHFLG